VYGYFFAYQDFLSWLTMVTVMVITLQQHQGWLRHPFEKSSFSKPKKAPCQSDHSAQTNPNQLPNQIAKHFPNYIPIADSSNP
jgi:hypothetical protein